MTMRLSILVAAVVVATPAAGQSALQVSATVGGSVFALAPGGSLPLVAGGIGQPVLANVMVRNGGAATATITGVSVTGGSEISLLVAPAFPVTLNANSSTSFGIQYLPSSGNAVTAQISVSFTENNQPSSLPFLVTGTSPRLAASYFIAPSGALADLNTGDRIAFPDTNIGSSATAVVNVSNRGTAAGLLQSVVSNGAAFTLIGSPAPVLLQPGAQASFNVRFTPQTSGGNNGSLILGLNNSNVSFALTGAGTAPGFTVTYALSDGNVRPLTDGAAISFPPVDINGTTTANIEILNQGTGSGSVNGISVAGAGFRLSNLPLLPATIGAGQSLRFGIVFAPSQAGSFSGSFQINLGNRSVSGSLTASTASSTISLIYVDPETNSAIALSDGATISFANTLVNSASTITVAATNSGAGTGLINSIALGGNSPSAFQLLGLPTFPASVPPSQQVRFGIRFNPQQQQSVSAVLLLNLNNGQTLTINLQARGTGPQFAYEWANEGGSIPMAPGGAVSLPDTAVGETSSVTITVLNSGSGDGQIPAFSVTGQGLSLTDLPAIPLTLGPHASRLFTLNFAPSQPGAVNGRLTIGNDTFTVRATGIGSRLTYTYTSAASAVPVADGGVVIFPPIAVGDRRDMEFTIQNTGTSAATISSINLAASSVVFTLEQLPGLPFNLDPGASIAFPIGFTPNNTGSLTASLRVNSSSFTLSGSGTQPAALPPYELQAPAGNQQPAQQPSIGLALESPYPLALRGTLTLTFVSSVFADDPAVQFASGGRSVNFTIPANSTQALFNGGVTTIAVQTGTTAGNIVITPSFAMQGGFNMTPATPDSLTLTIARSAPQLLSASITSQTLNSFTLVLSGFSTTRTVRQLDIQITPRQGENFSTTRLTLDVSSASSSWFQSAASQPFGGAFVVAIPFVLQSGSGADDLVRRLQLLSVTATNELGASNGLEVPIL